MKEIIINKKKMTLDENTWMIECKEKGLTIVGDNTTYEWEKGDYVGLKYGEVMAYFNISIGRGIISPAPFFHYKDRAQITWKIS